MSVATATVFTRLAIAIAETARGGLNRGAYSAAGRRHFLRNGSIHWEKAR
jgi:hypothetical protein